MRNYLIKFVLEIAVLLFALGAVVSLAFEIFLPTPAWYAAALISVGCCFVGASLIKCRRLLQR